MDEWDQKSADGGRAIAIDPTAARTAQLIAERLGDRTICCAESFTAGVLGQTLAAVPASSDWFEGSIVTYRAQQKRLILGVSAASVVSEPSAMQMAAGAAQLFRADVGLATTGVAGPSTQEGRPPSTVVVGWSVDGRTGAHTLQIDESPEHVVLHGVRAALGTLADVLSVWGPGPRQDIRPGG